jgi:hypothetical protein
MDEEEVQDFELDEEGDYDKQLEQLSLRYSIPNALGAMSRMSRSTEEARERLKEARARILARQYNTAIPLLTASAALGAPTQAGSTAESFANMAGALTGPLKDKMAFQRQQDEDLLGVDTALLGMDKKSLEAAIKLAQLRAKMQDPAAWRLYQKYLKEVAPKGEAAKAEFYEVLRKYPYELEEINQGKVNVDLSGRRPNVVLSTAETEAAAAGDVAEAEAEARKIGEATAAAKITLPDIEASSKHLTGLLDKLVNHKAMKMRVGASSYLPVVRGTPEADFDALMKQIGGAQFLKAYETLKGTGQITVIEGQKGEEAIARIQNAQTEDAFREAVAEFRALVTSWADRARAKAQQAPATEAKKKNAKPKAPEIPRIKDDADFDALESGTVFIDPEGRTRTKP